MVHPERRTSPSFVWPTRSRTPRTSVAREQIKTSLHAPRAGRLVRGRTDPRSREDPVVDADVAQPHPHPRPGRPLDVVGPSLLVCLTHRPHPIPAPSGYCGRRSSAPDTQVETRVPSCSSLLLCQDRHLSFQGPSSTPRYPPFRVSCLSSVAPRKGPPTQ